MSRTTRDAVRLAAVAVCVVLASAGAARAQDLPFTEGFAGYLYARASGESLHGWTAGLGFNFSHWLALDVEVASQSGSVDGSDVSRLSFLAGPRLSKRSGRVTPFVRLAAGVLRTSSGITVRGVNISARETNAAGVAGAGVGVTDDGRTVTSGMPRETFDFTIVEPANATWVAVPSASRATTSMSTPLSRRTASRPAISLPSCVDGMMTAAGETSLTSFSSTATFGVTR